MQEPSRLVPTPKFMQSHKGIEASWSFKPCTDTPEETRRQDQGKGAISAEKTLPG
jgi:hypothetical protein